MLNAPTFFHSTRLDILQCPFGSKHPGTKVYETLYSRVVTFCNYCIGHDPMESGFLFHIVYPRCLHEGVGTNLLVDSFREAIFRPKDFRECRSRPMEDEIRGGVLGAAVDLKAKGCKSHRVK